MGRKKKTAKSIKNLDKKTSGKLKFGSSHRSFADLFKKGKK